MPDRSRKMPTHAETILPKEVQSPDAGISWDEAVRLFKRLETARRKAR